MPATSASTILENLTYIQAHVTAADKSGSFTKGADYVGVLALLVGKIYELQFLTATLKGLTDSGDTQSVANLTQVLALLSTTPYALPTS